MATIEHLFWCPGRSTDRLEGMAISTTAMTGDLHGDTPPMTLDRVRHLFRGGRGYLNACSMGLPPAGVTQATYHHAIDWAEGRTSPAGYSEIVERVRAGYAGLVGVPVDDVAIASQTSVIAGMIAASLPPGVEVLCVDGDFSSMVFPFLAQQLRGVRVRHVPLAELADAIRGDTYLVAFSLVQSGDGAVADVDAIVTRARAAGAFTFCDLTQAAGAMPVDASLFDATACNAYKWMMCPRGVAFMTASPEFAATVIPVNAGWYAGDVVWDSLYGPTMRLAGDARRFDVSPAWPSWVAAEPALDLLGQLDPAEVHAANLRRANAFCSGIGLDPQDQAIVTWLDPEGASLDALTRAGITASGRNGRVRVAFHLWNDDVDAHRAAEVLRNAGIRPH